MSTPPTPEAIEPQPGPTTGLVGRRPLSIGEVLGGALRALRRYPRIILGLAALIAVLTTIGHEIIGWVAAAIFSADRFACKPGSRVRRASSGGSAAADRGL